MQCPVCNKIHNNKLFCGKICFRSEKGQQIMLQKREQTNVVKYGFSNPNKSQTVKEKHEKTCLEKYGTKSTNQLQSVKDKKKKTYIKTAKNVDINAKREQTCLEKYGVKNVFQAESVKHQISETVNEKYGKDHIFQTNHFKEQTAKTDLDKYGCDHRADKNVIQKGKDTNIKKFGVSHPLKLKPFKDKRIQTCIDKYGVPNPNQNKEVRKKIEKTCLERYGFDNPIKCEAIQKKIENTKRLNGTFNVSKPEEDILQILKNKFSDIKDQYKDARYPFYCDYYIPSEDLFIELQAFWTHGKMMFDESDKNCKIILEKIKQKSITNPFYKRALETWAKADVKKRLWAKQNNLKYLEIFDYTYDDIMIQINRVINGLSLSFSHEELLKEYHFFQKTKGNYQTIPNKNKIVLNFQKHFFEKENHIYRSDHIKRRKLIENRIFYLNKKESELTDADLLRGFKRSGIYRGFSHFSPLWLKAFIEEFDIASIYDPCGGWGHRLLGSSEIKYIYNDLDYRTYNNVKTIAEFFKMENKIFYNNDASKFQPIEEYEAVFTSPPYYNIEDYGNQFATYEKWKNWFDQLIKCSIKQNVKYFAIVINNDFENDVKIICEGNNLRFLKEIFVQDHKSHFNDHGNSESLYVFNVSYNLRIFRNV